MLFLEYPIHLVGRLSQMIEMINQYLLCLAQPQERTVSAVLPAPLSPCYCAVVVQSRLGLLPIEVAVCDTHVEVTVDSRSRLLDFPCLCCLLLHAVYGEESPHRIMVYDPRHSLTGLSCSPNPKC